MTDEIKTQTQGELKLPSAEQLLEAGVHFGHKTSRWHPKMAPYIFISKSDVHLFDLEKTLTKLAEALEFMRGVLANGGTILFVGTKPAARNFVKEIAQKLGLPYVSERWLGGTLTNFKTVTKRLQYYRDLEEQKANGTWDSYIKKERVQLQKKLAKLEKQLAGIKNLMRLPQAIFVVDAKEETTAIHEAKITGVPVVAICDTNVDLTAIDYVIPANEDASSSLKILMETIAENLTGIEPTVVVAAIKKEKEN